MENLIADGRIHPARIEEMYDKAAVKLVNSGCTGRRAGHVRCGHPRSPPELVNTLGRLRYRTSFGQNVLNHSLEVAYLASVMASSWARPHPGKRAGLLHDLGKAVDHEVEGSHAVIGADLARRFGERPRSSTLSRPITTMWRPTPSSMCSFRPPTPSPLPVPVPARTLDAS